MFLGCVRDCVEKTRKRSALPKAGSILRVCNRREKERTVYLANLTWPAVEALDRRLPVVIPLAAVEQHGHHLPVNTDSMLLGEVVRRAEESAGARALIAPLQWLGNSPPRCPPAQRSMLDIRNSWPISLPD